MEKCASNFVVIAASWSEIEDGQKAASPLPVPAPSAVTPEGEPFLKLSWPTQERVT